MTSYMSPWVMNFANSMVGVGVLAMPFVFEKCGIILASILLLAGGYMTGKTCEFLMRASIQTRKSTIEQVGFFLYGDLGKLMTELGIIGLLIGTLVAFQVVIGDLAPAIVNSNLGIERTWSVRALLMIASSCVILPLTLMRNISSLAGLNAISISFYGVFVAVIGIKSLPALLSFEWVSQVNMWQTGAIFQCIPIVIMAYTCQMQVLVMYTAIPDPTMNNMMEIVNKAINLVSGIYISTGIFGYVAFYKQGGIAGNIMENFPSGMLADLIKLGFWLSIIVSFPLITFPVRAALNSLIFSKKKVSVLHDVISSASDYIAPQVFVYISAGLVFGTLITGILVPKIEIVLSVTGALVGTLLCYVIPSMFYMASGTSDGQRRTAQFILVVGAFCAVFSTISIVSSILTPDIIPTKSTRLENNNNISPNEFNTIPIPLEELPVSEKKIDDALVKVVDLNIGGGVVNTEKTNLNIRSMLKDTNNKKNDELNAIIDSNSERMLAALIPQQLNDKPGSSKRNITVEEKPRQIPHKNKTSQTDTHILSSVTERANPSQKNNLHTEKKRAVNEVKVVKNFSSPNALMDDKVRDGNKDLLSRG